MTLISKNSVFCAIAIENMRIHTCRLSVFLLLLLNARTLSCQAQDDGKTLDTRAVVFEESFSPGLSEGWKWLRENPARWCVRNDALEIRVMPGVADTVENALLRPLTNLDHNQRFAVTVTVENAHAYSNQYEQAGITWYVDDRPVFKFVKELVDGEVVMIPGKVPVEGHWIQLRLEIDGEDFVARFRKEAKEDFQEAAKGKIPRGDSEAISLQCYHGPAAAEHWFRFDDFKIEKLQ